MTVCNDSGFRRTYIIGLHPPLHRHIRMRTHSVPALTARLPASMEGDPCHRHSPLRIRSSFALPFT
jgi:hypothetical protein